MGEDEKNKGRNVLDWAMPRELIKKMLESEIIYQMKGKGKGKYLFKRK